MTGVPSRAARRVHLPRFPDLALRDCHIGVQSETG